MELSTLTVRQLRQRVEASGFSAEDVEKARDSHDPREALTALLLFQHASVGGDMHKLHEQIIGDLKIELMSLPGVCYS